MKYEEMIQKIIENIGGESNIDNVYHCATRLRFTLKDRQLMKKSKLEKISGVISVVESGGQVQIIIGQHVGDVYNELIKIINFDTKTKQNHGENAEEESNFFNKAIDIISGVFTPILGMLTATGVIKGLLALLTTLNILNIESGTYQILNIAGDSFFYFLPIFLGYTAMKKFGGTPFLGMVLGGALIHPNVAAIMGGTPLGVMFENSFLESVYPINFLGVPVLLMSYASSVVPIIVTCFFAAKLEKALSKRISNLVKAFAVPMLVILIIVPLTFLIIGPIATWLSSGLGELALIIYNLNSTILGFFYGALIQVCVMFGLHWGFVSISINNIATLGYDPVTITGLTAGFAQAAAVLMLIWQQKDEKMTKLGIPSFISALFGITEPAIYGITLPLKRPFIIASIASGIGGAIMGSANVKQYAFGANGIFGFMNVINPETGWDASVTWTIVACIVSFLSSMVLMYFFGKPKKKTI